jgi:hypothetical protein
MSDRRDRLLKLDKMLWRDAAITNFACRIAENGKKRVLREDMFDVGNEKLLVLLFVMQPQRQHRLDFREKRVVRVPQ